MSSTKRKTVEEFINEAKSIHGDKYDYSKVEYVNQLTPVCIICPEHGEFWQKPKIHLFGHGCQECGKERGADARRGMKRKVGLKRKMNTDIFKERSNVIHGSKYDYSNVKYVNAKTTVRIICPTHGEFSQSPSDHLRGCGCKECLREKKRNKYSLGKDMFIQKSKVIFGEHFDYSKVNYVNNNTKVCVICPDHGEFYLTPANHLRGRGCPICKAEKNVYENNLWYIIKDIFCDDVVIRQYRNRDMLGEQSLDFYIPSYNIAIEHQGSQHFHPVKIFGGEDKFEKTQNNDIKKYQICNDNGIRIVYFAYEKYSVDKNYFTKVYTDIGEFKDKLISLKKIKNE